MTCAQHSTQTIAIRSPQPVRGCALAAPHFSTCKQQATHCTAGTRHRSAGGGTWTAEHLKVRPLPPGQSCLERSDLQARARTRAIIWTCGALSQPCISRVAAQGKAVTVPCARCWRAVETWDEVGARKPATSFARGGG